MLMRTKIQTIGGGDLDNRIARGRMAVAGDLGQMDGL
jgi:hypothetical protein